MNILFLFIAYPKNDQNKSIYTDLVEEFAKNRHNVYVVAPNINEKTTFQKENGIPVLRVETKNIFNVNIFVKGINILRLPVLYKKAIDTHLKNINFDWIISATPPITFASLINSLKQKMSCRSYLIVRDIFPQNAKDLGLIKNPFIFYLFRMQEKMLYKNSDILGCMSNGNIKYLQKHNPTIPINKYSLLPNWIKIEIISELSEERKQQIKKKYDIGNKFIALFGGNLGKPQRIDFILELAKKCKTNNDILFLLIGDGTEKETIKETIIKENLSNVRVYEMIHRDEYKNLSQVCDIGMVNLSEKFSIPNIPSRTLAYWEASIPILAAIDKNTDYGEMLDSEYGGLWSITGDIESYYSNLLRFKNDPTLKAEMGRNGREALSNRYSVKNAYQNIINHISHIS